MQHVDSRSVQAYHYQCPWPCAIALGLLICALVSGCAMTMPQYSHKYTLSHAAEELKIPEIHQSNPELCGLAAIEMVAAYYKDALIPSDIRLLTAKTLVQNGLSGDELVTAFKHAGYFAVIYRGLLDHSISGLYTQIDAGRPIIVMIRNPKSTVAHYIVVSGYDSINRLILFMDPANGLLTTPVADFVQSWSTVDQFTLLAVPYRGKTITDTRLQMVK